MQDQLETQFARLTGAKDIINFTTRVKGSKDSVTFQMIKEDTERPGLKMELSKDMSFYDKEELSHKQLQVLASIINNLGMSKLLNKPFPNETAKLSLLPLRCYF